MNVQYINSNTHKCVIEFDIIDLQEILFFICDAKTRLKLTETEECTTHKWYNILKKTLFDMFNKETQIHIIELEKYIKNATKTNQCKN